MNSPRISIDHPIKRVFLLIVGLALMALGIAFSIKAELGTSPISSAPYVTSVLSGLSVGVTTILVNTLFILLQIAILRRQYDWFQLLQFPGVIVFGFLIDLAEYAIHPLLLSNYFEQWVFCVVGIILVALGVSIEVMAKLITTPGEGVVLAVCKVSSIKFGNMKVIFDVSLVCISVLLSLLFLGRLDGVREGTIAAAVCVGLLTKQINKGLKKAEPLLFA